MPVPSPTFYPTNLQARAAWHANNNAHAQAEGLNYGLTQANLEQIKDDNNMMQFIAGSFVTLDAFEKAWTAFRNGITTEAVGTPQFEIPDALVLQGAPVLVPNGIFQRVIEYRDVVRASLNYTTEVGAAWGYEGTTPQPLNPVDVKPTITVEGAATNYHFSVVAAKREQADSFKVFVLRKGTAGWVEVATATGKSLDVHLTPQVPGEPEQLQVRIQLRKNNQDYGQPSDPAYVTINP